MNYSRDFEVASIISASFAALAILSLVMRNRPANNKVLLPIVFACAISVIAFSYYYAIYSIWPETVWFPSLD